MTMLDWNKLLSEKRFMESKLDVTSEGRSNFQKDFDRIAFSFAFRRLQGKTQVHPIPHNDHIHNRLTHSIETSSIGRTLGTRVGNLLKQKNELPAGFSPYDIGAIVQAACLAHDIGNPPFGHAGEYAIREWFNSVRSEYLVGLTDEQIADIKTFEGNAQGFRLITRIENNVHEGGMRLSLPTLGSYLKYPWTSSTFPEGKEEKFSCYQSELKYLRKIAEDLGLNEVSANRWCRHPLSYLVEAADDICYALMDIEDGLELGLLRVDDIRKTLSPILTIPEGIEQRKFSPGETRKRVRALRGKVMQRLIDGVVQAFDKSYDLIMSGEAKGDIFNYCDEDVSSVISEAKKFAKSRIFSHRRKIHLEIGVYSTIDILLSAFCDAAHEFVLEKGRDEKLSFKTRRIVEYIKDEGSDVPKGRYELYLSINDFVSGMTDNYASFVARQIGGMAT